VFKLLITSYYLQHSIQLLNKCGGLTLSTLLTLKKKNKKMGYISFKKAGGEVDLLPAENIVHVGNATSTSIVIVYGIGNGAGSGNGLSQPNPDFLNATVSYGDTSSIDDPNVRGLINAAIELANGASGPAIRVGLPTSVGGVDVKFGAGSAGQG